jgi:hypothetical protein
MERLVLDEMDERLAAIGWAPAVSEPAQVPQPAALTRQAIAPIVAEPVQVARPGALVRQTVRLRDGRRESDALCEVQASGIRITDATSGRVIAWPDARSISVDHGRVHVVSPTLSVSMAITLDGVPDPALAALFARVLEDGRRGALEPHTGALHELELGIDRAVEEFADADDPIVPIAIGAFTAMAGLIVAAAIPSVMQLIARVEPAPGGFAILPRIAFFDPRVLVAAFAGSAALAAVVGRVALGPPAMVWARGTLRGWHRNALTADRFARRTVAQILLLPKPAAIVAAVALVVLLPSAFARTVVDPAGIHSASGLPLLSSDRDWSDVMGVQPLAVGFGERASGFDTLLTFRDGSTLSTRGRDLAGGSERALFDLAKAHAR